MKLRLNATCTYSEKLILYYTLGNQGRKRGHTEGHSKTPQLWRAHKASVLSCRALSSELSRPDIGHIYRDNVKFKPW